ncbi:MAG: hypothetical protein ACOY3L_06745 [Pseudomonadota bacterium]
MTFGRPDGGHPLWIVKLGGSLARSPALPAWLDAIATGGGMLVLVPGGGSFADEVRAMQRRWGFDDATAHRLALLAMEQYGLMLASLQPQLQPATSRSEIARVLGSDGVPVWLPTRMALGRPDIPESWDVTSDSLAAWLAAQLQADGLVLVKSVPVAEGSTIDDLVRLGTVDPLLPAFLGRGVPDCRCIDVGQHAAMKEALGKHRIAGTRVILRAEAG